MPGPDPAPRGAAARGAGSHGGGLGAASWADTLRSISEEIWQLGEGSGDPGDAGAEIEANLGGVVQQGAPARCLPQEQGREQKQNLATPNLFVPADTPCAIAAGPASALKAAPGELREQLGSWHGAGIIPVLFLWVFFWEKTCKDTAIGAASLAPAAPALTLLPGAL